MPVANKLVPMAECLNHGLRIADNDDIRQALMQPDMLLRTDVLLRGMHKDLTHIDLNSVPSQHEDQEIVSEAGLRNTEFSTDHVSDILSIDLEESYEENFRENNAANHEQLIQIRTGNNEELPKVPSNESIMYFLPVNYNKRNPWRRIIGLHVSGHELRSATYPARCSVKKLRFAQAKKPLNYLYSYFSVEILDCDDKSSITIGVSRKDYPSKVAPGRIAGSIGYCSDTGSVFIRDSVFLDGPRFTKGDVIGCGIIYPTHYKLYADLSTDDNSDGMTDVVLTSLLNTNAKSMDFVCNVLNLNAENSELASNSENSCNQLQTDTTSTNDEECDYYNENFVESRTQVEVYFTHNMHVVGKVLSHVPVGGFYPTVHIFSSSAIKMQVDLNPPLS